MPSGTQSAVQEFEVIEGDDALHDFGGTHGSKGHDFACFWVIVRLTELEAQQQPDYVFVCEYMQDVAEFDSSMQPTQVRLYQLKKKEDGYWGARALTGQTGKSKKPKDDKPVIKLIRHVRTVKSVKATGAFVSNGKFDVSLATGQSSVNDTRIGLHLLDDAHTTALKIAIAQAEGIKPDEVDLSAVELRCDPIAVNDLQRHVNGIMLEFLAKVSPPHAGQAASLVDTLYVRLKARSRRTEKCTSWAELLEKRGLTRGAFTEAIGSLNHLPDKERARRGLLAQLGKDWRHVMLIKVEAALTQCAVEKVLNGGSGRWRADTELKSLFEDADARDLPDQDRFEAACSLLVGVKPELLPHEIRAIAIYEMTEWDLSQTHA